MPSDIDLGAGGEFMGIRFRMITRAHSDDVNGFRREVNKVGAKRRWQLQ